MSAPLVRLVSPDLALLEAAIDDPSPLGGRSATRWPKAGTYSRAPRSTAGGVAKAPDTVTGKRFAQMAKSGKLKMAARRYKASCVSAARTIVRPPTAGR